MAGDPADGAIYTAALPPIEYTGDTMTFVLRTVRAKLAALVLLPIVLLAVVLPVLGSLLRDELVDEADDRLVEAERAFQTELDDDLASLMLSVHVLARDPDTHQALAARETGEALALAHVFGDVYPRVDILLVARDGTVLADVGPTHVASHVREVPELANLPRTGDLHAIAQHGCAAASTHAPAARLIATPAGEGGWVIACEPLDREYVVNAASKLGLELALLNGGQGRVLSARTDHFPATAVQSTNAAPRLVEDSSRTWAVARIVPRLVDGSQGASLAIVAAIDVTDLRRIVWKHIAIGLALVLVIGGVGIVLGVRLASVMSRALTRVVDAFRKLEQQEYVHVPPMNTRDELETLAVGFNSMVEGLRERDNLRTTFGKYMTESVMQHLLSGKVRLGGETLTVTILFSDIRSFTSISEKMEAHALVGLLNEYFTEMVGIVMRHNGVVDKYIGDAILAVFGAPVPHADDAKNAALAAADMRDALVKLNERLATRGIAPLRTGIGLHTGEVVAGNIGSEQRMEYTVIGDAVNVASRLEGATKDLGVEVLMSAATYEASRDVVHARLVKEITVKGRQQPVTTYELLGKKK